MANQVPWPCLDPQKFLLLSSYCEERSKPFLTGLFLTSPASYGIQIIAALILEDLGIFPSRYVPRFWRSCH